MMNMVFTVCIIHSQGMMVKANYSDVTNHKQIHVDFLAKIKGLKAPLDAASLAWAKQW
jgi:hemerythrin